MTAVRRIVRGAWLSAGLALALAPGLVAASAMDEAVRAYDEGRYGEAQSIWRELVAENDDPAAMFYLGVLASEGHLGGGGDAEAVRWFSRAAEKEYAAALFNLGVLYWSGRGVAADTARAAGLWRRAAELDLADAQYNLATAYLSGEGVAPDERKARFWLRQAAGQGHGDAVLALQRLEGTGAAGPVNEIAALSQEPVEASSPGPAPPRTVQGSAAVPVYPLPNDSGVPLMLVPAGTSIEVVEEEGAWLRVSVTDGLEGWVSTDWLRIEGATGTATASLRVRVLPEVSPVATPLNEGLIPGEQVQVLSRRQGWALVRLPPRFTAWLKSEEVRDTGPGAGTR